MTTRKKGSPPSRPPLERLATADDYIPSTLGGYVLSFDDRMIPGVWTEDPKQGAEEYNAWVMKAVQQKKYHQQIQQLYDQCMEQHDYSTAFFLHCMHSQDSQTFMKSINIKYKQYSELIQWYDGKALEKEQLTALKQKFLLR
ncbi:hypothetical protein [Zooshikella ganghwensis]|nr:hypothetical protein [Zooshikella ganghwensis]